MILAIDFDGTLVRHEFPAIGPEVPGAFEWLRRFQAAGASLILWTMRSDGPERQEDTPLADAVAFCRERGVEFWGVNSNPGQHSWTSSRKVFAHAYIDDAAFGCPLVPPSDGKRAYVDWSVVGPAVMRLIEQNR